MFPSRFRCSEGWRLGRLYRFDREVISSWLSVVWECEVEDEGVLECFVDWDVGWGGVGVDWEVFGVVKVKVKGWAGKDVWVPISFVCFVAMDAYKTGLLCIHFWASRKEMFTVYLSEMISCSRLYFGHSLEEDGYLPNNWHILGLDGCSRSCCILWAYLVFQVVEEVHCI